MEAPEALIDVISTHVLKQIRQISKNYLQIPIDAIDCVVMQNQEAHPWIKLRHIGENEDNGTVKWCSDETHRFDA